MEDFDEYIPSKVAYYNNEYPAMVLKWDLEYSAPGWPAIRPLFEHDKALAILKRSFVDHVVEDGRIHYMEADGSMCSLPIKYYRGSFYYMFYDYTFFYL